jgi:arylsulfatase A-like enzyme
MRQSRRTFLKAAGFSTLSTVLFHSCIVKKQKPNLLFLWTDQQRFDTMAVYGNKIIKVPHLNNLAEKSIVFKRAYISQPVCTPSRSTVMTGLWPHQNGCTANNIPLKRETKCFPELIDDPDYTSAYMGKWHLGDEICAQHGFDEWTAIEDGYTKHYSKDCDKNDRSPYHHFLVEKGYGPDTNNNSFSRGFAARRPIEHCKPSFLENNAREFIERNKDNPFMLYVNFLEPHTPFWGPLNDLHSPEEVGVPKNADDPLEENEPLRYKLSQKYFEKNYGTDKKRWAKINAIYHGLVSQVDRAVGGILQKLDELGLHENTIIVYTSDHGEMMGSHGMFAKQYMYEESARVPWLMQVPGKHSGQVVMEKPVSHIDLVPTLLDYMGHANKATNLPGKSLVPFINGETKEDDYVFVEWNPNVLHVQIDTKLATKEEIEWISQEYQRSVISPDGWKLCLSDRDKHQLFNLNDDPLETINLYDSGKHKDIIKKLTEKIHNWQISVDDKIKV